MGTDDEIAKAKKLLREAGLTVAKKKQPNTELELEIIAHIGLMMKDYTDTGGVEGTVVDRENFTTRNFILRAAIDERLNEILDKHFKGDKRKEFDDKSPKKYNTEKTLHQDIMEAGLYKKYKLVERNFNKVWNAELFKIVFDSDYDPRKKK